MPRVPVYQSQIKQAPLVGNANMPQARADTASGKALVSAGRALQNTAGQVFNYAVQEQKQIIETDLLATKVNVTDKVRDWKQNVMFQNQHADAQNSVEEADTFFNSLMEEERKQYSNNPAALAGLDNMASGMRSTLLNQAGNYSFDEESKRRTKEMRDDGIQTTFDFNDPSLTMDERSQSQKDRETNLRVNAGQTIQTVDGVKKWVGGKNVDMELKVLNTERLLGQVSILMGEGNLAGAKSYLNTHKDEIGGELFYKMNSQIDVKMEVNANKYKKSIETNALNQRYALVNEGLNSVAGLPIEEQKQLLYKQLSSFPAGKERTAIRKLFDEDFSLQQAAQDASVTVAKMEFFNDDEILNTPHVAQLENVEQRRAMGTLSDIQADSITKAINEGMNKITYDNNEASIRFKVLVDNGGITTKPQVDAYFNQHNFAISQMNSNSKYFENGGNINGLSTAMVKEAWKRNNPSDTISDEELDSNYTYVLANLKDGEIPSVENARKLISDGSVSGEIRNKGFWSVGFGHNSTRAEADASGDLARFVPSADIERITEALEYQGIDVTYDRILEQYQSEVGNE